MTWREYQLRELSIQVTSGGTPPTTQPQYYGGDIPWLRTQEVTFNRITDTELTITEDGLANSAAKWIPEKSVIVAMYGNSAGRVAVNHIPLTTNQACCNLIVDTRRADYRFLYYRLLLDYEVLHQMAKGAAQNNLNAGQIKAYSIRAPLVDEQTRIADILVAYDDLIENNRRRIALLEDAARQIYREWFVRLRFPGYEHTRVTDGVPAGWERVHLAAHVETQYGFTETATDEPVGPKFLRGTDINKTPFIDWSTVPYCPIDEALQRKYRLRVGDILIIRMADPGKVAIVEREVEAVFASYLIRVVSTHPRLTPYYLFYSLSDDRYQGFISSVSTGSTRKTASAPLLVDYYLHLPPLALVRSFESSVQPFRKQINTLLVQNERLHVARDLLLPRLMSGKIAA